MHITLRSRIEHVGGRDVEIVEVTRAELHALRWLKWLAFLSLFAWMVAAYKIGQIAQNLCQ
jgi:hypothetical protein